MNDARRSLIELLDAYRAAHPEEGAVADRIADLVAGHADCYERSCRPGHLTASAWVVSADGHRHLLLHHRKLGKWLQPGGHADGETDLVAVAKKEVAEESGLRSLRVVAAESGLAPLDIDVHAIPERRDADGRLIDSAHDHHDLRFLLQATAAEDLCGNDESTGLRWCDREQVESLTTEESVLRLLRKAEGRLGVAAK